MRKGFRERLSREGAQVAGALSGGRLVVAYGSERLRTRTVDLKTGELAPPVTVAAASGRGFGFPAMTTDGRGRLWLAYHCWMAYTRGDFYVRCSSDGGRSWAAPILAAADCTGDRGTGCIVGLSRWRGRPVFCFSAVPPGWAKPNLPGAWRSSSSGTARTAIVSSAST